MAVLNNTGIRAGASGATGVSAYKIEKSLRLDGGDDAHLNRTFGSGGSTTTWTLSFWVKGHDIGQACYTFTGGTGTSSYINAFDVGQFRFYSSAHDLKTNARYRDPSAWYHVVVVANTTDSTANDRTKVYINGTRLAVADFATHTQPSQSAALGDFNSAAAHYINRLTSGSQEDMMLAEVHFVDAAAKEASDFGETHEDTGQWIPKKYTGSYGTTGFYLKFNGTDLGEDSAGSNDWTANNLLASQGNSHYFTITSDATDSYYTNSKDCINTGAGSQSTGTLASVLNSDGSMSSNNQVGATGTTAGFIEVEFNPYIETSSEFSIYGGYWGNGTYEITATITYADDSTDTETSSGGHSQFTFRHSFSTSGKSVKKAKISGTSTYMCMSGFTKENSGTPLLQASLDEDTSNDTPTTFDDGGNGTGNYCTLNPLHSYGALSQGNLTQVGGAGDYHATSTWGFDKGKWYGEFTLGTDSYPGIGIINRTTPETSAPWTQSYLYAIYDGGASGVLSNYPGGAQHFSPQPTTLFSSGVFQIALDVDNGKCWVGFEDTWYSDQWATTGNPATGANPTWTLPSGNTWHFWLFSNGTTWTANFGQRPYRHAPPSGFKACNTYNLPDPTIADPSKHYNTLLYSGDGSGSERTITGLDFEPDVIWVKKRSSGTGGSHLLWDAVRGGSLNLSPQAADQEYGLSSWGYGAITGNATNGIKVTTGSTDDYHVNDASSTYAAWNWKAGSSNTSVSAGDLNTASYDTSEDWSASFANGAGNTTDVGQAFRGITDATGTGLGSASFLSLTDVAFDVTSTISVWVHDPGSIAVSIEYNGTTYTNASPTRYGWTDFTVPAGSNSGTLKAKLASSSDEIRGVKVDGKILVDSNVTPPNIPTLAGTYRANTDAGFSIVSYVGTGANATVAHGLNAVPQMIIVKNRDAAESWPTYHVDVGNANRLYLNVDAALSAGTNWNSTTPTSSVFSIGNNPDTNGSTKNIIAYCWSEVEGYSKIGSYEGNGFATANGPYVYCGFRPAFLLIKNADEASENWFLFDSIRDGYNINNHHVHPNISDAEGDDEVIDLVSNGFKIRTGTSMLNEDAKTFIFLAIAESPFKYANAR